MLLGDVSKIKTGNLDVNAKVKNGRYPFFTCAQKPEKIDSYSFDCECVLIAGNGNLNVKYYKGKFDAYQRTYVVEVLQKNQLDTRFLFRFLNKYLEKLRNQSIGGVIKYIKMANLTDIKLPNYSLEKQKQIVEILDTADNLRQKRKEQLALLDDYIKSVFLDMFGDPVRNDKEWNLIKLSGIGNISSGSTPSRKQLEYFGGKIPWVKTTEVKGMSISETEEYITNEGVKNSSCRIYPIGSVLIAMYGQGKTRGQVGMLSIPAATNQACAVIEPRDRINALFLFSLLRFSYNSLRGLGRGGNQPNLNVGLVKNYTIFLPPLEMQKIFASIVEQVEQTKQKMRASLDEMDNQFNALMQRWFG